MATTVDPPTTPATGTAPQGTTPALGTEQKTTRMPGEPLPPARMMPDDDPNHKMAMLIAKRDKKTEVAEGEKAKEGEKTTETPAKTGGAQETKPASGVVGLIAQALKMRPEKGAETKEKATEQAKTEEKKAETKAEPAKTATTIVTKKKAEPKPADPMRIAAEAAGAAAREAVTAAMPKAGDRGAPVPAAEDELTEEYRYQYEVAKYLGTINPKYKGAEKSVLQEFARTEQYARNWEAQNAGKVFDPEADEHEEFYESIKQPWNEHDFRKAEIRMEAKRIADEESAPSKAKLRELEQNNARMEMAQVVNGAIHAAGPALAKAVDEAAHGVMLKDGFPKLEESDPITSEELVRTLNVLAPMIETAILVDDPKQRLDFDAQNNPAHKQWLNYLFEKEEAYRGQEDEKGRLFASRTEFVKLNPGQQKSRWYLTVDHLVAEMISDGAAAAKERIQSERERQKKIAISLGYVPKDQKNGELEKKADATGTTKAADEKKVETSNAAAEKPASPSAGAGPKIDSQGEKPKTRFDGVFGEMTKTLFGR